MRWYRFLADLTVIAHLAYFCFVVLALPLILLGGYLGWAWVRNFWFRMIHFAMIAVVVAEELLGIACPLTTWERDLRLRAGGVVYRGSFIGHWVHELLFVDLPPWAFTVIYCAFGLLVLASLVWVPPRWPRGWRHTASGGRSD